MTKSNELRHSQVEKGSPRGVTWSLYILDCDGRYYTGVATDVERRLGEHRGGKRGARFTRGAQHVHLVYAIAIGERGLALRAEARVKRMKRIAKREIVEMQPQRNALLAILGIETGEAE